MNITADESEETFAVTGNFTSVNAFGKNSAFKAGGFAIWVPSKSNWLRNIAGANSALNGQLTAYSPVPDMTPVYGGMISSQGLDLKDVVELVGSGRPELESLGIQLSASSAKTNHSSPKQKRATSDRASGTNYKGIYDGFFYDDDNLNITILGGSFSTTSSDGSTIENLVFINNTESTQTISGVSGLDPHSVFVAMDTYDTKLWAGGAVNGSANGNTITGLVVYELHANRFAAPHPPALGGDNVVVNAIAAQPVGTNVYVGGDYSTAGSLPCGP